MNDADFARLEAEADVMQAQAELASSKAELARERLAHAKAVATKPSAALYPRRQPGSPSNAQLRSFFTENEGRRFTPHAILEKNCVGYDAKHAQTKGTASHKARNSLSSRMGQIAKYLARARNGPKYQVYRSPLQRDPLRQCSNGRDNRQKLWWVERSANPEPRVMEGKP